MIFFVARAGRVTLALAATMILPAHASAQSLAIETSATATSPAAMMALFPAETRDQALNCLSTAIVREAGHEPVEGQQAVAQVIMNRVRSFGYPKTVCGVVFQGSERSTGCQFTFTCDGSMRRPMSEQRFRDAQDIAEMALSGALPNRVDDATHYHAFYVAPSWSHALTRVGQIGAHIFYRAGGSPAPGQAATRLLAYSAPAAASPPAAPKPFLPWGLGLAANGDAASPALTRPGD